MSDLVKILNQDGRLVVTSRQIAEDFNKRHGDVLEKVDNLIKEMSSTEKSVQYFIKDSYKDNSGKSNKEYLLTRDGFSLLVMGFTGVKAFEWKLKYIESFNKMEQELKETKQLTPMQQLKLQYQVIENHEEKITKLDTKVEDLENNMPLFNVECKELQALVRKVATKILGGYKSNAYCNNSLRGRVYSDVQRELKRQFGVERYEAIKRKQLESAKEILEGYKVPLILESEIEATNSQIAIDEVAAGREM